MQELELEKSKIEEIGEIEEQKDFKWLEEYRKSLPPFKILLPYPYSEIFEFVEGSKRQQPYWRVRPKHRELENISKAQAMHISDFLKATQELKDCTGTIDLPDGREISYSAWKLGKMLKGKKEPEEAKRDESIYDRIKRIRNRLRRLELK